MKTSVNYFLKSSVLAYLLVSLGCSCNETTPKKTYESADIKIKLQKANKLIVKNNAEEIDAYITRHNWKVESTGTGLKYYVYQKGSGKKIIPGQKINIEYWLITLDGSTIINEKHPQQKYFVVAKENAESGMHEVLPLLRIGDHVKVVIPPHLAFGLSGNEDIPPMATLIYDLKIIN